MAVDIPLAEPIEYVKGSPRQPYVDRAPRPSFASSRTLGGRPVAIVGAYAPGRSGNLPTTKGVDNVEIRNEDNAGSVTKTAAREADQTFRSTGAGTAPCAGATSADPGLQRCCSLCGARCVDPRKN
jgi:hypothetical protein